MNNTRFLIDRKVSKCLLCDDGACSSACVKGLDVAGIIRSLRFKNTAGAAARIPSPVPCMSCTEPACMLACSRRKLDEAVSIPQILTEAALSEQEMVQQSAEAETEADLSTRIGSVVFENPFLLSSSIVGSDYDMIAKAFDMGWAGVAFKTIGMFIPEEVSPRFDQLEKEGEPFIGFKNIEQISDHTLEENLRCIARLKKQYPKKIILASIMGRDEEEWTILARLVEKAGADIVECNFSCPHMVGDGLGSDVGTRPELVAKYTAAVKKGTSLPVLAKMTPNITNMEIPALAAKQAGADGIAAINTVKSILNVNLDTFASGPSVDGKTAVGGYSGKAVKPIALRFIHDLKTDKSLSMLPVSGMGGIENWEDAAEFIAMGCSTVQITTAVMQYGYRIIEDLTDGLKRYMQRHGMRHIADLEGKALEHIVETDALDRSTICYPKFIRKNCLSCGRCFLSCYDGGHQAIRMEKGLPMLIPSKCAGCHLCITVCPAHAIEPGTRVAIRKEGVFYV